MFALFGRAAVSCVRQGRVIVTSRSAGDSNTALLLSMARCFHVRDAIYVSTPITTGRLLIDMRRGEVLGTGVQTQERPPADWQNLIRERNLEMAHELVSLVQERTTTSVIDPTQLVDIPGWDQSDYHRFWTELIAEFAKTVVFADGWQYSSGCALEFVAAVDANCSLMDHHLRPLSIQQGVALLKQAVEDLRGAGLGSDQTTQAIESLKLMTQQHVS